MVNTAPDRSVRLAAVMRAAHRLDEAAADRKPSPVPARRRSAPHAVEFVEDALEIGRRNAGPFVQHLHGHVAVVAPRA